MANLNCLYIDPPPFVYVCFCELSCDSHLLLCNPVVMLAPGSCACAALWVPFGYGLTNTTSPWQNARHPPLGKWGWRGGTVEPTNGVRRRRGVGLESKREQICHFSQSSHPCDLHSKIYWFSSALSNKRQAEWGLVIVVAWLGHSVMLSSRS